MSTSHDGQNRTFRCADAGNADCRWETSGASDDEIVRRAEAHGRKDHGMGDWSDAMRSKVRNAIKARRAACTTGRNSMQKGGLDGLPL